jgi:hypothetical protein
MFGFRYIFFINVKAIDFERIRITFSILLGCTGSSLKPTIKLLSQSLTILKYDVLGYFTARQEFVVLNFDILPRCLISRPLKLYY